MPNGEFFHYTTAEGLKGIIDSQNMWATHFRFLNDSSEVTFSTPFLEKLFYDEIRDLVFLDDIRFGSFNNTLKDLFVRDEAAKLFRSAFTAVDQISPLFLTSLCYHTASQDIDHGLLSQWRGYGRAGGYCIVFDRVEFLNLVDSIDNHAKFASVRHKAVEYMFQSQNLDLSSIAGVASAQFRREFNRLCETGQIRLPTSARIPYTFSQDERELDALLTPLLEVFPFIKHSAFAEESEYRIAAACLSQSSQPPEGKPPPHLFRLKESVLVPYVKLFEDNTHLPISRIIVGPGRSQVARAYGLEAYLSSKRMKIAVTLSEIPYTA